MIDLTGRCFGHLQVIGEAPRQRKYVRRWYCACDCGASVSVAQPNLLTGHSISCWNCGRRRATLKRVIHDHAPARGPSRTYRTWRSMQRRCYEESHIGYQNYGGRGITVCERWLALFANFLADMGERPIGMTIDRIDPDGRYEPRNCRWATALEQRHNRRTRQIEVKG